MRALAEALSRRGDRTDAVRLLAAHDASARAAPAYGGGGGDARPATVSEAAQRALGDAYDACYGEGSRLGDEGAVNLARTGADSSLAPRADTHDTCAPH